MTLVQTVKERPILFSGAMVRALLAGTKTQTRRIVKTQPIIDADSGYVYDGQGRAYKNDVLHTPWQEGFARDLCPYGQPGGRLYVREDYYQQGHWEEVSGVKTKGGRQKWKFVADAPEILFDCPASYRKGRHHKDPFTTAWHKRLGRFMPRVASRLLLEITAVRCERLQRISCDDAVAEGIERIPHPHPPFGTSWKNYLDDKSHCPHVVDSYSTLWEFINGPDSWAANPWVWVVEFKIIEQE